MSRKLRLMHDTDAEAAVPDDAEIVRRVLAGDCELYALLVRRHQAVLYRHALGMVGDADVAADLVQDALVKGYSELSRCTMPDRVGAWLYRIVANRCLDHLKSARRRSGQPIETLALAATDDDPGAEVERAEMRDVLLEALATLPEAQREAILLKHVEDCSYEEMSERLGVSVSALKMRVMRAREALQAVLGSVLGRSRHGEV
jgi:RNA polymerase sigma-70 factor, ECF subfamily